MFKDVRVSPSHLRELGVTFSEHHHLKMVTGWGQSMEPTIRHRDPLIVDVSIREFVGDGIYFFPGATTSTSSGYRSQTRTTSR